MTGTVIDLDIRGAEGLARIARDARRFSHSRPSAVVKEMTKEIRRAVPPIRKAVKVHELKVLPHRGGLAKWVAKGSVTARVRSSANNAGVTIKQGRNSKRKRTDMKALDGGQIRHPVHGNRGAWVTQSVPAGAFTKAVTDEGAKAFREAVVVAVDRATAKYLG